MISGKNKWLFNYALPCTAGNEKAFDRLLSNGEFAKHFDNNYSREAVRDYFMEKHNLLTLDIVKGGVLESKMSHSCSGLYHLLIPYTIEGVGGKGITCQVAEPFYDLPIPLTSRFFDREEIEKAKKRAVLEDSIGNGDVLLVHALQIVDSCTKKELEKYSHLYETQLA